MLCILYDVFTLESMAVAEPQILDTEELSGTVWKGKMGAGYEGVFA